MEKKQDMHVRIAPECSPRAELRPARLMHFAGVIEKAGHSERIEGNGIRINVTPKVLHASRKDGEALHRFGVFEFDDGNIGLMLAQLTGELHAVFADLGDPEVKALLAQVEADSRLNLLAVTQGGDVRLMVPSRNSGLDVLIEASRDAMPMSASAFEMSVGDAVRFLHSEDGLSAAQLNGEETTVLVAHFLVTATRYPEMFRTTEDKSLLN